MLAAKQATALLPLAANLRPAQPVLRTTSPPPQFLLTSTSLQPYPFRYDPIAADPLVGLDYFGARYMSSAQGRFTSPDAPFADQIPEDPQSWNLYVYVRNNPLRYTDPTGGACFDGRGAASCGNYILGGLKEVANIPSNLATSINRVIDPAIAWTGVQFGAAPTFQPANVDQAEGMEAAAVVMLVSPLAEAGAAKVAGLGRASSAATKTAAATETGVVYELPPQAASGKPYVGRTARSVEERMATRTDGRTGPAKPVDTFSAQDRAHGQYKEQKAINARGGVQNLDNKRNEVNQKRYEELKKKYEEQQ